MTGSFGFHWGLREEGVAPEPKTGPKKQDEGQRGALGRISHPSCYEICISTYIRNHIHIYIYTQYIHVYTLYMMSVIVLVTLITVVIVFLSLCCSWWRSQLWLLSTCSPINYVCYAQYCSDVSQHDVQYALLFGNFLPITININISKTTSQLIGWNWACPGLIGIHGISGKLWKMMAPGYPSLKRAAKISKLCRVQRWWLHLCCILSWMIIPVALPMWLVETCWSRKPDLKLGTQGAAEHVNLALSESWRNVFTTHWSSLKKGGWNQPVGTFWSLVPSQFLGVKKPPPCGFSLIYHIYWWRSVAMIGKWCLWVSATRFNVTLSISRF